MKGFEEIDHIPFYCEDCNVDLLAQCYFLLARALDRQKKMKLKIKIKRNIKTSTYLVIKHASFILIK